MSDDKPTMKVEFICKRKKHEVWGINSWELDDTKKLWLYVWGYNGNCIIVNNVSKVIRAFGSNIPFCLNDDETLKFLNGEL